MIRLAFSTAALSVLLFGCAHTRKPEAATKPEWIQQSDKLADEFSRALAALRPEVGSELGYSEFDHLGLLYDSQTDDRDRQLLGKWSMRMDEEIANTSDPEVKADFKLFQNWIQKHIEIFDAYREAHEIEFSAAGKSIFMNLQTLVNPQTPPERKRASVDRFKVYVHGDTTHMPLTEALIAEFRAKVKKYEGQHPLLPYRGEVEVYLKDAESYLAGVEELLKGSGRSDWAEDYAAFKKQIEAYTEFAKKEVLSVARKDPRIPPKIYAQELKNRGIERTPEELIRQGLYDYKSLYKKFREQAQVVAKRNHLKDSSPPAVLKFLKSKPVTQPKEVEELYRNADQRLEQILKEHNLISIPASPLRIRVAGDAESKAAPVPHLVPPPLVNNKGERPEFVVPSSSTGLPPFDDFSSAYAATVLTAHEGRPGHDMQFSQMLDHGLSLIRSRYAFNNVNVEGWGLYAEDLVYPYLSPEEQLVALQTRLWRIARMFLDPQVQLGKIPDQRVIDVFTKELGVSKVMAGLELRRYKYEDIGQAPSYYEGYLLVQQMRANVQKRLGADFNIKCFNDRLLSFGLLPLRMSAERMDQGSICR